MTEETFVEVVPEDLVGIAQPTVFEKLLELLDFPNGPSVTYRGMKIYRATEAEMDFFDMKENGILFIEKKNLLVLRGIVIDEEDP